MKSKHTPSPWEIEYDNDDYCQWENIGPCKIEYSYMTRGEDLEMVKADAKLISNAPVMLDFIIYIKDFCDECELKDLSEKCNKIINKITA